MKRHRVLGQYVGRLGQLGRSLVFALGRDDLCASFPLGLCLPGHRALHLLRKIDVLYLHQRNLDPPWVGMLVEDFLELYVERLPFGEKLVELYLP